MHVPKLAEVIPLREIHTLSQSRELVYAWMREAERFEVLYELAAIQRDMSEALLKDALSELERLQKLTEWRN